MDTVIERPRRAESLKTEEATSGRARVARSDYLDWEQRGLELANSHQCDQIAFGLWWIEGKPWSRQRTALVSSPQWPGPSAPRLRTLAYVVRRMRRMGKTSFQKDSLAFTYYEVVAALDPDVATQFLQRASDHHWRVEALKAAVASYRQSHQPADNIVAEAAVHRKYTALYLDPPWGFDHPAVGHRIQRHYPTLAVPAIMQLPVADLMTKDAYVFLWVPNSLLPQGLAVLNAWGSIYHANMCWIKRTRRLGTGNFWRNGHELLLLGVRGEAGGFLDMTLKSWLEAPP